VRTLEAYRDDLTPGRINVLIWESDLFSDFDADNPANPDGGPDRPYYTDFFLRSWQYRNTENPDAWADGVIRRKGAYSDAANCGGDIQRKQFDYYKEAFDMRERISSPLSIALTSTYDSATRSGSITARVVLDAEIVPPANSVNKIVIVLYERNLNYSVGGESAILPQAARHRILFEDCPLTRAGEEGTYTVSFAFDPAWVPENMGALAMVQNYDASEGSKWVFIRAKEIYNSGFLADLISHPPSRAHSRPVTKP
jgi:hypothetical protein